MSNGKVHCHFHKCLPIDQAESGGTNPQFENYRLNIRVTFTFNVKSMPVCPKSLFSNNSISTSYSFHLHYKGTPNIPSLIS